MPAGTLQIVEAAQAATLVLALEDDRCLGRQATLQWHRFLRCRERGGITTREPVGEPQTLTIHSRQMQFAVPDTGLPPFRGELLDAGLSAELDIDDGVLFDSKLRVEWPGPAPAERRRLPTGDATQEIDPPDRYHFRDNLRALEPWRRLLVMALVSIGALVILINSIVGVRDTFVPESEVWIYDHSSSDGDGELPLLKALAGSGGLGGLIWLSVMAQLRRYLTVLEWGNLPTRIGPHSVLPLSEMFRAFSRVPLQGYDVRIVAANIEVGIREVQERTKNGTRTRRDVVRKPLRTVVLHTEHCAAVAVGSNLAAACSGHVDFAAAFTQLHPPFAIGGQRLELRWELQIVHPRYVDQELEGPAILDPAGFAEADTAGVPVTLTPSSLPGG